MAFFTYQFEKFNKQILLITQNERNSISVADANMRTTSLVESMNSVIQRSFPSKPHIFKFLECLRLHEAMKSTDLFQLASNQISNSKLMQKRAEDKRRNEKIELLSTRLEKKKINAAQFLEHMCESSISTPAGM